MFCDGAGVGYSWCTARGHVVKLSVDSVYIVTGICHADTSRSPPYQIL